METNDIEFLKRKIEEIKQKDNENNNNNIYSEKDVNKLSISFIIFFIGAIWKVLAVICYPTSFILLISMKKKNWLIYTLIVFLYIILAIAFTIFVYNFIIVADN